jgi:CheY-like chemotaxis protein
MPSSDQKPASNSIHPSVLVAEDNPVNRQVMALLFTHLEIPVEFVTNGREVLEHCMTARHAFILMDIQMPEVDGLEATRQIRSNPSITPQPIIIALTAQSDEAPDYYTTHGFDAFLQKPLKPAALKKILDQFLVQSTPALDNSSHFEQLASPNSPDFDPQVLDELAGELGEGSDEILVGLIDTYLNHTPTLFAAIDQALPINDLTAIHRAAHTLKSSSANLGLIHLSKISEQLELWLKSLLKDTTNQANLSKINDELVGRVAVMHATFSRASLDLKTLQIKLNNGKS